MSFDDPFDNAPLDADNNDEPQGGAPSPKVKVTKAKTASITPDSDGKVVLTFKGGRDFDAPWIVIHANGLQEAHDFVVGDNASLLATVMERVKVASMHFAGKDNQAAPAQAPQRSAPQVATQAPGGETRFCEHGEMVFKSGVSKAGKPYKLFSCTAPRESQCKAQFLN